jgi:tetratricopeptide (TPR) repeat protein
MTAAPQDPSPQFALVDFYLSRNDTAKAQSVASGLLRQWPADIGAARAQVRVELAQGDLAQAKSTAKTFAHGAKDQEAAAILLADVLDRAKDPAAPAAYQDAVRAGHDSETANLALITYYTRSGDKAKAVETARAYAGRHQGLESNLLLADTLISAGKNDEAKTVLATAMAGPQDGHGVVALAHLAGRIDPAKGESILVDWLKSHADDLPAKIQLANLYVMDGNSAAARDQLEPVVRLEPYNPSALNDLAWSLQKSDPARAIKLASLATRISPRSGEILDTLAWLKWQQNDKTESLALLRQAHALSPEEPNIAYHLAVALQASGDRDGAVKILQAVLKANPSAHNNAQVQELEAKWH